MAHKAQDRLRSGKLRHALRVYAENILSVFGRDMHRLSDSGVFLKRESRIRLHIQLCYSVKETQRSWTGDMRGGRDSLPGRESRAVPPPMPDVQFLDDWVKGERGKLLIVAPFGSGKSVLLAELACRLAESLRNGTQYPEGTLPPLVPLPVRLRDWHPDEHKCFDDFFFACCLNCSNVPIGADGPTIDDLKLLMRSGRLLPLFDGLDEVAAPLRSQALSGMERVSSYSGTRSLKEQFILTSRPDSGAEDAFTEEERYTLRELTAVEVRAFVQNYGTRNHNRSETSGAFVGEFDQTDNEFLLNAYENAPKHIDQALRRPLFAAAWCYHLVVKGKPAPNSISDLMMAVYEWTMCQRGLEIKYNPKYIIDSMDRLGAVLTQLADADFGWTILREPIHTKDLTLATMEDTLELAMEAGFVSRHGLSYRAMKLPITEYLVGRFLASLCEGSANDPKVIAGRQKFVKTFQSWFWRFDFDGIWLYSFDFLWRGSEALWDIATGIVNWLCSVSQRCIRIANWTETQLPGQLDDDRFPFHCEEFVHRVLVPEGGYSNAVKRKIAFLLIENSVRETEVRLWRRRKNFAVTEFERHESIIAVDACAKLVEIAGEQGLGNVLRALEKWSKDSVATSQLTSFSSGFGSLELIASIESAFASLVFKGKEGLFVAHQVLRLAWAGLKPDDAKVVADGWAREGRITDVTEVLDQRPELAWFIRRFERTESGERVVYGVCRRTDKELLLDPDLDCAPPDIQRLLQPEGLEMHHNPEFGESIPGKEQWSVIFEAADKAWGTSAKGQLRRVVETSAANKSNQLKEIQKVLNGLVPDVITSWKKNKAGKEIPAEINREKFLQALQLAEALSEIRKRYLPENPDAPKVQEEIEDPVMVCPSCGLICEPNQKGDGGIDWPLRCTHCPQRFDGSETREPLICFSNDKMRRCLKCRDLFDNREPTRKWKNKDRAANKCPKCEELLRSLPTDKRQS